MSLHSDLPSFSVAVPPSRLPALKLPRAQRTEDAPGALTMKAVRAVVMAALVKGADVPALLAAAELSPEQLQEEDAFLPVRKVARLFNEAARLTGDAHFGLHMAELTQHQRSSDVLDYAWRNSPTLGEGLRRAIRYHALLQTALEMRLEIDGTLARVLLRPVPGFTPTHHGVESLLTSLFLRAKKELGDAFRLQRVGFMHATPEDITEHSRIFQAPVLFSQPHASLVFDRALLELPLAKADPALAQLLDRLLVPLGLDAAEPLRFTDRVRRHIAEQMQGQCPAVEDIAARMHMSPRTLQRRLQDEGSGYQELLNDVRRELALHHLGEKEKSISEVAFLLGFSEVSTFHRAFKRWSGQTPAEFRRQRRA